MELKKFPINSPLKGKRSIITGSYKFSAEKTDPPHTSHGMGNSPLTKPYKVKCEFPMQISRLQSATHSLLSPQPLASGTTRLCGEHREKLRGLGHALACRADSSSASHGTQLCHQTPLWSLSFESRSECRASRNMFCSATSAVGLGPSLHLRLFHHSKFCGPAVRYSILSTRFCGPSPRSLPSKFLIGGRGFDIRFYPAGPWMPFSKRPMIRSSTSRWIWRK